MIRWFSIRVSILVLGLGVAPSSYSYDYEMAWNCRRIIQLSELEMLNELNILALQEIGQNYINQLLFEATQKGYYNAVQWLIFYGADVNTHDSRETPLIIASKDGHLEIVRFLVSQGANIEYVAEGRKTALHWAAINGHYAVVHELLKIENINKKDSQKCTALMHAARKGHLDVVRLLVEHGASIDTQDIWHRTALIYAAEFCHGDIVQFLIAAGADVRLCSLFGTALTCAVRKGSADIVKIFLNRHIDIDLVEESLVTAEVWEKPAMVKLLHEHLTIRKGALAKRC